MVEPVLSLYDKARVHGLSHDAALDATAAGRLVCWCGKEDPCPGGAQRHVGCSVFWSAPATEKDATKIDLPKDQSGGGRG